MSGDPRPGETVAVVDGGRFAHGGRPPFVARSASARTSDWPIWLVAGADGINRLRCPDQPGATLLSRQLAHLVADALNIAGDTP